MPRIRSIKPEFWDSPDTAGADLRVRLLYIAMWNWADDYGIGDATVGRLNAFAFPNDDISMKHFEALLEEVADSYGVVFFEHRGRPQYVIPAWERHQRTEKRAKARDDLLEAAAAAIFAAQGVVTDFPSRGAGSSVVGTGEQGNWGTGEQGSGGKRLPEGWEPPVDVVDQMRSKYPHVDLDEELEKFINYWGDIPGAKGRKLNWVGTYRNWISRASGDSRSTRNGSRSTVDDKVNGYLNREIYVPEAQGELL